MTNRSSPPPEQTSRRAPSVVIAFRTFGRTLRHGYDNLGTLLVVSVCWYLGALLIQPLGAVTAGLHRVVLPMTEEPEPASATWTSPKITGEADEVSPIRSGGR